MSDGNYNRSLLPHTPYQSGMKTGKAMAKMKAIEAFKDYLKLRNQDEQTTAACKSSSISDEVEIFKKILEQKIL